MHQLVLIRHGESIWNQENRFTGWHDIDLAEAGIQQAKYAGQLLKQGGFEFDIAYTSVLQRAMRTLWLMLDEMDRLYLPTERSWRLNERHYGALTGLNKAETAKQHGDEQVKIWRRSFDTPPPLVELDSEHFPGNDSLLSAGTCPVLSCPVLLSSYPAFRLTLLYFASLFSLYPPSFPLAITRILTIFP